MRSPRRILLLEDNESDAQMLRKSIKAEWPECEVVAVTNKPGFEAAFKECSFDLILSDYMVPGFPGMSALAFARERCPEVPFLFVSGSIGGGVGGEVLKG